MGICLPASTESSSPLPAPYANTSVASTEPKSTQTISQDNSTLHDEPPLPSERRPNFEDPHQNAPCASLSTESLNAKSKDDFVPIIDGCLVDFQATVSEKGNSDDVALLEGPSGSATEIQTKTEREVAPSPATVSPSAAVPEKSFPSGEHTSPRVPVSSNSSLVSHTRRVMELQMVTKYIDEKRKGREWDRTFRQGLRPSNPKRMHLLDGAPTECPDNAPLGPLLVEIQFASAVNRAFRTTGVRWKPFPDQRHYICDPPALPRGDFVVFGSLLDLPAYRWQVESESWREVDSGV